MYIFSENDKVLDVGSGLGGQARFIASETNCHVTAIELQTALHQAALDLTQRCQLADKVKQVEGDFLETSDGKIILILNVVPSKIL